MSRLVDERVVRMEFDNKNFEKNIDSSIDSLDRLKQHLNLSGVAEAANKSLNSIDTSVLTEELEKSGKKWSVWEIAGITAISNITNRIIDLGIKMTKSLSVDNLVTGWSKYEEKTRAVATLMGQGFKMETVEEVLEKLNWYTDETSYNFTDMVSSIGKFTAAGRGLEESVDAMIGIANWAALSGQNAQTASRAMYQLSQSLSSGAVKLQDWRSIQNANMDTAEFRKTVIETAVELGTLQQSISGKYTSKKGNIIGQLNDDLETLNTEGFVEFLTSDEWFTSDVLLKSLQKYSAAVDDIYRVVSDETNGIDTATDAIRKNGEAFDEFGLKAFQAAQEARTFTDAVESIREASASKWSQIFENIFGNYENSRVLWTDLSEVLYEFMVEPMNKLVEVTAEWRAQGGFEDLFGDEGALWNIFDALKAIGDIIITTWREAFAPDSEETDNIKFLGEQLKRFTAWLKDFTKQLIPSADAAETMKSILRGLFSIVQLGGRILRAFFKILAPFVPLIMDLAKIVLTILAEVSESIATVISGSGSIKKLSDLLKILGNAIVGLISGVGESVGKIQNGKKEGELTPVQEFVNGLVVFVNALLPLAGKILEVLGASLTLLSQAFVGLYNFFKSESVSDFVRKTWWVPILGALAFFILRFISSITQIGEGLGSTAKLIKSFNFYVKRKSFAELAEGIKNIGVSILLIATSIAMLSSIDTASLWKGVAAFAVIISLLGAFFALMGGAKAGGSYSVDTTFNFRDGFKHASRGSSDMYSVAMALVAMSASVLIIAHAMKKIGEAMPDWESTGRITAGITMIIAIVAAFALLTKYVVTTEKRMKRLKKLAAVTTLISGSVVAFALSLQVLAKALPDWATFARVSAGIGLMIATLGLIALMNKPIKSLGVGKTSWTLIGLSTALVIFSGALLVFSLALNSFKNHNFGTIAAGFGVITAGVAGLLVVAKLAAKYVGVILMLSAAIALIAASISALIFSVGKFGDQFGDKLATALDGVLKARDKIKAVIKNALLDGLDIINDPAIVDKLVTLLTNIFGILTDTTGPLIDHIMAVIETIVDKLNEKLPKLAPKIAQLIGNLLQLLGNSVEPITNGVLYIIDKVADYISTHKTELQESLSKVIQAAGDILEIGLNALFGEDFGTNFKTLLKSIGNLASSTLVTSLSTIAEFIGPIAELLGDVLNNPILNPAKGIKDIIDSIKNTPSGLKVPTVEEAVTTEKQLAEEFKKAMSGGGGGGSAYSGVTTGVGTRGGGGGAYSVMEADGRPPVTLRRMAIRLASIMELAESMKDDDSVSIKPVVDLSEIQNGNRVHALLDTNDYSLSGSIAQANSAARTMNSSGYVTARVDGTKPTQPSQAGDVINNTFNIQSDNPREVAEEVSKIIQTQINRRHAKWAQ